MTQWVASNQKGEVVCTVKGMGMYKRRPPDGRATQKTNDKETSTMRTIASLEELESLQGEEVAVSDWIEITQQQVNLFAEATGDHQWIHVDVERAKRESPFGAPIAHGFLTFRCCPSSCRTRSTWKASRWASTMV
jgi:acyl dehydratase